MFLQVKGEFVPEQHTDYVSTTVNMEPGAILNLFIAVFLLVGYVYFRRKRQKQKTD